MCDIFNNRYATFRKFSIKKMSNKDYATISAFSLSYEYEEREIIFFFCMKRAFSADQTQFFFVAHHLSCTTCNRIFSLWSHYEKATKENILEITNLLKLHDSSADKLFSWNKRFVNERLIIDPFIWKISIRKGHLWEINI